VAAFGDASFTRSSGPCASILTTHRGAILGGGAIGVTSRLGKPAQAGGTSTGVITNGRSAARRVSPLPQGRRRGTTEKDGGRGLPPCEDARARVWLLARRSLLQKSVGDVWPRISSANALQKERQGRVNGGLALRSRLWVKPRARAWGETTTRASAFTAQRGKGPAQGSGWREIAIRRSHHRQRGEAVAGPGL
jgi:hypothetical protein